MIDLSSAVRLRVKRANTDWWIGEKAVCAANGKTYIAYCTDMGEIHVKELDPKCSRAVSRDVCLTRLNSTYADEHNAPGMCVTENGAILVMYTGHAVGSFRYRVTTRPFDLDSFCEERYLDFGGSVTYAQVSYNTALNTFWVFSRVDEVNWSFACSKDGGLTWSKPFRFIRTETGGQTSLYYLHIRKLHFDADRREYWFFAVYGHPRSDNRTIRAGLFDDAGNLLDLDLQPCGYSLYDGKNEAFDLAKLTIVYDAPPKTAVRLLEVSPTLPLRVGLATFDYAAPDTSDDPIAESITYYMATYRKGKGFTLSEPITKGGEFLAPGQTDGSQTYVGGMACHYGVGNAGLHPVDGGCPFTDRVYIARFDTQKNASVLDSFVSTDGGKRYAYEQTVREIPRVEGLANERQIKIWRPTVPMYSTENLPVYWHEGTYSAHTGGWHSDVVMYVEYDD